MTDFRFLHAADIHLDSPLHGLSRYEGVPLEEVRGATRAAFDNLVQLALSEMVDFLVIAGDLFDGDWRDMGTGLYFAAAMGRLAKAAIPAFILNGNHDAASVLTKSLPWPETVKVFRHRGPESHRLDDLGVVLHGQSFANAAVTENLAQAYPARDPSAFNIGVLHTCLAGHPGHAAYAPCSLTELEAKGYDYWALGHVHEFIVLREAPHVVFPGNLQGRNIRETGPRGAVLVEVRDRIVTSLSHMPLDVVRWARIEVDCSGATRPEEVHARVRDVLSREHAEKADERPMVARVVLIGDTELAGRLRDDQGRFREEVRALAAAVSPELFLEKLSVRTRPPPALSPPEETMAEDFLSLLAEAPNDPALAEALARELSPFLSSTPAPEMADADDLNAAARTGDWPRVLKTAADALPARLIPETFS